MPPAAERVEVLSSSPEVLNLRCSHTASDEIEPIGNWELVTDVYQKAQPGPLTAGKTKVKFTQHCEITLALDMLARHTQPKHTQPKRTKRKIEIGVSKACCEWCCEYLKILTSAYSDHPILVRASHGKQPDGWMMPPNGPKSIAKQMTRSIEGRVDEVIWKIVSRRRSDSNGLPDFTEEVDLEANEQDLDGMIPGGW
jgi:OTT_1508-like deaminase